MKWAVPFSQKLRLWLYNSNTDLLTVVLIEFGFVGAGVVVPNARPQDYGNSAFCRHENSDVYAQNTCRVVCVCVCQCTCAVVSVCFRVYMCACVFLCCAVCAVCVSLCLCARMSSYSVELLWSRLLFLSRRFWWGLVHTGFSFAQLQWRYAYPRLSFFHRVWSHCHKKKASA